MYSFPFFMKGHMIGVKELICRIYTRQISSFQPFSIVPPTPLLLSTLFPFSASQNVFFSFCSFFNFIRSIVSGTKKWTGWLEIGTNLTSESSKFLCGRLGRLSLFFGFVKRQVESRTNVCSQPTCCSQKNLSVRFACFHFYTKRLLKQSTL